MKIGTGRRVTTSPPSLDSILSFFQEFFNPPPVFLTAVYFKKNNGDIFHPRVRRKIPPERAVFPFKRFDYFRRFFFRKNGDERFRVTHVCGNHDDSYRHERRGAEYIMKKTSNNLLKHGIQFFLTEGHLFFRHNKRLYRIALRDIVARLYHGAKLKPLRHLARFCFLLLELRYVPIADGKLTTENPHFSADNNLSFKHFSADNLLVLRPRKKAENFCLAGNFFHAHARASLFYFRRKPVRELVDDGEDTYGNPCPLGGFFRHAVN